MSKVSVWIYGAGGFGREVWNLAKEAHGDIEVVGFVDDNNALKSLYELPVLPSLGSNQHALIAIADPIIRKRLIANNHFRYPNLISKYVDVSQVKFGVGCIVCKGSIFTIDIEVGDFVIINLATTIGHDVKIGNFVSIMPGVHLSGNVTIGEGVLLGTGAVVLPGVKIGAWSKIGAGAVVTKDVEAGSVMVGTPARCIKMIEYAE